MSGAKLSVIMSCYNQARYLRQAVESVLMQKKNFPIQLIITDDHSTEDDSAALISEYAKRYPDQVKALLNKTNGRYLANVLRAKAITKTEYFTLLDADDFWTDEYYLQNAVEFLEGNSHYTVYCRNVRCLYEDGHTAMFISPGAKDHDYEMEDYLKERILVPQTTGAVFRNVIFKQGIPDVLYQAIGTLHERSYEGDVFRFLMHLDKGFAHFENRESGVYRIANAGIWSQMSDTEHHIVQAQCFLDFYRYFGIQESFFVGKAFRELNCCLQALSRGISEGQGVSDGFWRYVMNVCEVCSRSVVNKVIAPPKVFPRVSLKDRLKLFLYWRFKLGLDEKGLI